MSDTKVRAYRKQQVRQYSTGVKYHADQILREISEQENGRCSRNTCLIFLKEMKNKVKVLEDLLQFTEADEEKEMDKEDRFNPPFMSDDDKLNDLARDGIHMSF